MKFALTGTKKLYLVKNAHLGSLCRMAIIQCILKLNWPRVRCYDGNGHQSHLLGPIRFHSFYNN